MGALSKIAGAASNFINVTKTAATQVKQQVQEQAKQVQAQVKKAATQVTTAVNNAAVKVKETYEQVVQQYKANSGKDSTCYQKVEQTQTPLQQLQSGTHKAQVNSCQAPQNQLYTPLLSPKEQSIVDISVKNIRQANQNVTVESEEQLTVSKVFPYSITPVGGFSTYPLATNGKETTTPDYVKATQSFENALKDQNSYVQNAILYQTRSELVSLGEKMPQLENKFEVYQAIQSFSRSGEALGQDNIDHLTTPLFEGLQKGGITESGSKNVANGIETAIKSGDGALFSASLTHQFSQKATENYTGGKIPEENKKNIALSERFTNAIMDSLEKVKKNYDKANANFQNHAKVLSQASTNFPQFTEDEVAAGIDSYRQANREDFQSYENASKVLASTLEGASYIESENFFKVTRKDNVMNAQVNFEETKAVLEKTPELIQSESGYQALKSALIRNAQESTFLKTATQIAENYPLYEKKLDFALNYTSQRATQELSENISVNSYNQIKNLHQGTSKAVTNPELKSVYSDSANLTSEIISDTSSSLSSYTTMASEIEKLIGNRVPPDLAELGRSFTLYAAGANTYKFYKNPNAENSLDLLESSMDVGGLIKPGSKLFARGNLIISGAMSVHELSEGDIAGAFTDALPIAGLACGPAAPACIAGGAVLSSVIDVSRTIYQNSTRPYQKDLQPYLEGALTEMNNHEADLNLNSEKIKDVAYRLRDVNGDFLSANQGLEAYAQATGLDSRELFKSLIQQDDKEIKDFVNDTIRAIPDMEENSTQLYFDEASLQTIQESYNEATSNDHTYKIERKSKLGVPISDTKANESVA